MIRIIYSHRKQIGIDITENKKIIVQFLSKCLFKRQAEKGSNTRIIQIQRANNQSFSCQIRNQRTCLKKGKKELWSDKEQLR